MSYVKCQSFFEKRKREIYVNMKIIAKTSRGGPHAVCRVIIDQEEDIYKAVTVTKMVARSIPLYGVDETKLVIAVMELSRNILAYAQKGEITIRRMGSKGVEVIAADQCPSSEEVELVLTEGSSSGKGLGLGLSGVQRLVNEFHISSSKNFGTYVRIVKWANKRGDMYDGKFRR